MTYFSVSRRALTLFILLLAGCGALSAQASEAHLRLGGTGAAIGVMTRLAEAFAADNPGISAEVLPSLGSGGGIRALADGAIDVAVSARALKPAEAENPLVAAPLSRSPFVVVTSNPEPQELAAGDLAALYANPAARWADGSPVRIILRPKSDSDSAFLMRHFDGMEAALGQARLRPEVPVAATDQENVGLAGKIAGSLTTASLTQIVSENAPLHVVPLDGVAPTLENLESERYPFYKELTIVHRQDSDATVRSFMAFVESERGRQILRDAGNLPLR